MMSYSLRVFLSEEILFFIFHFFLITSVVQNSIQIYSLHWIDYLKLIIGVHLYA
jgi:hypothetical protein